MKKIILLFCVIITLFCNCKKDKLNLFSNEEEAIFITDDLRTVQMNASMIFTAGEEGYQYAYGSLIELSKDTLFVVTTRFRNFSDWSSSDIVGKRSNDGGKSWSPAFLIQENYGQINTMHPSMVMLPNKTIILTYGVKQSEKIIDVFIKKSFDKGLTWTVAKKINTNHFYYMIKNDRITLNNKRLLMPMSYTDDVNINGARQNSLYFYSDDEGETWKSSTDIISQMPLEEPGLVAVNNHTLLMNFRNPSGKILFARSTDNGNNWKRIRSNINTPVSPQKIYKLPKINTLAMVWNNTSSQVRSPLSFAVSKDGGVNWKYLFDIEKSDTRELTYASVTSNDEFLYITYHNRLRGQSSVGLKLCKIKLEDIL